MKSGNTLSSWYRFAVPPHCSKYPRRYNHEKRLQRVTTHTHLSMPPCGALSWRTRRGVERGAVASTAPPPRHRSAVRRTVQPRRAPWLTMLCMLDALAHGKQAWQAWGAISTARPHLPSPPHGGRNMSAHGGSRGDRARHTPHKPPGGDTCHSPPASPRIQPAARRAAACSPGREPWEGGPTPKRAPAGSGRTPPPYHPHTS